MQIGNLDVNQAIETAKKRLHALINVSAHGYQSHKVIVHSEGNGLIAKITVGEYEIDGFDSFGGYVDPYSGVEMLTINIRMASIEVRKPQGTSRRQAA
ncbi:hypothetical protein [Nitrosomonas communis]|uniref:hypothetical protein n=1 Tax=Nitrosomonas communis TaxID=44574 RepID=UPI003D2BADDB